MAEGAGPSIIQTAIRGWQDAFDALSRMPLVFGIAVAALCILNIVTLTLFVDPLENRTFGAEILSFLFGIVQGFLLTPLAIAVHRFVLLGEIAGSYVLNPRDPRFMRFFLFTMLVQALMLAPSLLIMPIEFGGGMAAIFGIAFVVVFVVVMIVMVRTLILFPAVAVDAPGAAWSNALADTKGHSWRVFFTVLVTSLPAILIVLPAVFIFMGGGTGSGARIVISLIQSVVGAISLAAFAAMASHLYAAFAARLGRPAGL